MNNNNKQLSFLSDEKLLDQTKILVQKERNINFQILRHLEEIEVRKLYLSRGFSSLFDYTIKELGYSGSAAHRRIKAMRLCKETPEIEDKLKSGKLNLTTAVQLQQFFEKTQEKNKEKSNKKKQANFTFTPVGEAHEKEDKNCNNHLQTMDGSLNESFQETENIKTECMEETRETILNKNQENENLMSQNCYLDKTQKINLIKKVEGKSSKEVEKILAQLTNKEVFLKDKVRYVNTNKIKMNIIVQEKCLTNLEKLKHLLSHKNPSMSYGELLLTLSEIALEKYDPQRRYKRRLYKKENNLKQKTTSVLSSVGDKTVNERNKCETVCKSNNSKAMNESNNVQKQKNLKQPSVNMLLLASGKKVNESNNSKTVNENNSFQKRKSLKIGRYIPAQVRDYVWSRDKGQCTYVCSKTNQKCSSKHLLQIDHIQPFSLGGSHSSKNLRLLCAVHNQYRNRINDNKKLRV